MKFALLTVSYSGLFYSGKPLSLEQQIHKAKLLGFQGLAIEAKRPIASPLDLTKSEREKIKFVAGEMGIELCCVESMSNFAGRYMEERENNLAMMRMVFELAHDLDVRMVKVFAAWPGIINDEENVAMYAQYDRGNYFKPQYAPDLRMWQRAISGIRETAAMAADMGITLVLQNHAPVLRPGYEDVLAMTQEIDRENVKICLDVPLFYERQQDDYVREAVMKCKDYLSYSHFGAWNFSEAKNGDVIQEPAPGVGGPINYEVFTDALRQIGYDGYLVSEYCLPVIKNHTVAGMEDVDLATILSLRYMKQLVPASSVHA
ncbi:MAG TPA: sugar phosphate isomerase/epimerase family protein [Cyclobacteriaceae bacterium]|nr:sugar phosphate isomerase/epimerase family protein [Cyclobacteriaceae bacterium]